MLFIDLSVVEPAIFLTAHLSDVSAAVAVNVEANLSFVAVCPPRKSRFREEAPTSAAAAVRRLVACNITAANRLSNDLRFVRRTNQHPSCVNL
jgi:hypothetical protein